MYGHSPCTKMLTFYMDIYEYVNHLKFPFPLTFSAKTLWVPANCKISSENFVGARAPRTRRSAPHVNIWTIKISNHSLKYSFFLLETHFSRKEIYLNSFILRTTSYWNSLPVTIKQSPALSSFCRALSLINFAKVLNCRDSKATLVATRATLEFIQSTIYIKPIRTRLWL